MSKSAKKTEISTWIPDRRENKKTGILKNCHVSQEVSHKAIEQLRGLWFG